MAHRDRGAIPSIVLVGFAVSSTGGPLALTTLYLTENAHVPAPALVLPTVVGLLLFLVPLFIWLDYARTSVSSGGLYAFVQQAAGRRVALLQGIIWSVSYLLYLPYTVTYVLFNLSSAVIPLPTDVLKVLALGIALALSALVLLGRRLPIVLLAISAVLQLGLILLLGILVLSRTGARLGLSPSAADIPAALSGALNISLLFVCLTLVLFLGGEAKQAAGSMRLALLAAFGIVGLSTLFSAVVLASGATPEMVASDLPGALLANRYATPLITTVIGIGTLTSIVGLVVAEFLALSRLWGAMFNLPVRRTTLVIAAVFVLGTLVSWIDPAQFYSITIVPSLVALYLSQFVVFVVYPVFTWRVGRRVAVPVLGAVAASAWALYGIYGVITQPPS